MSYVAKDDLELLTLLPLLSKGRDYKHSLPCLAYTVPDLGPSAMCSGGSTQHIELHPSTPSATVEIRLPTECWD